MTSADDPQTSDTSSEAIDISFATTRPPPFWRGIGVGELLAVIVPIALYFAVYRAGTRFNPFPVHPNPHDRFAPGPFGVELGLLAISGVILAVYRRASGREAIVQWTVPPLVLMASWLVLMKLPHAFDLPFLWLVIGMSLGAALNWTMIQRGSTNVAWPSGWLADSVFCGFAHMGLILVVLVSGACCIGAYE